MIFNIPNKAKDLFFNNKKSGLKAIDVQDAIDEVNSSLLKIKGVSLDISDITLTAGSNKYIHIPVAETPIGIIAIAGLPSLCSLTQFYVSEQDKELLLHIKNTGSNDATLNKVYVTYVYK